MRNLERLYIRRRAEQFQRQEKAEYKKAEEAQTQGDANLHTLRGIRYGTAAITLYGLLGELAAGKHLDVGFLIGEKQAIG